MNKSLTRCYVLVLSCAGLAAACSDETSNESDNTAATTFSTGGTASGATWGQSATGGGSGGTAASDGSGSDCQQGQVSADEVVWIGDSWIEIPGTQHTRVRDLARDAGALGPNEDYVDLAVSGSRIATIVNQYNSRQAGATQVKVLIMDGGGIDTIQGGGSQASVDNAVSTFRQHLDQVGSDGTVEHIIYFLYPELPTIAGVAALRPGMQQACAQSTVPCYFLDLQPLWEGHPKYTGSDNIHPSTAGGNVIGEAIWAIMQHNCIAQ